MRLTAVALIVAVGAILSLAAVNRTEAVAVAGGVEVTREQLDRTTERYRNSDECLLAGDAGGAQDPARDEFARWYVSIPDDVRALGNLAMGNALAAEVERREIEVSDAEVAEYVSGFRASLERFSAAPGPKPCGLLLLESDIAVAGGPEAYWDEQRRVGGRRAVAHRKLLELGGYDPRDLGLLDVRLALAAPIGVYGDLREEVSPDDVRAFLQEYERRLLMEQARR